MPDPIKYGEHRQGFADMLIPIKNFKFEGKNN